MEQVPALAGIIAKVMVLLDQALGVFATVKADTVSDGCSLIVYSANVTEAGHALSDKLAQLIFNYISYLGEFYAALLTTSVT